MNRSSHETVESTRLYRRLPKGLLFDDDLPSSTKRPATAVRPCAKSSASATRPRLLGAHRSGHPLDPQCDRFGQPAALRISVTSSSSRSSSGFSTPVSDCSRSAQPSITCVHEASRTSPQITLMSDGASVFECTSAGEVVDLLQGGQGVFGIAVGRVWNEVEGSLSELPVNASPKTTLRLRPWTSSRNDEQKLRLTSASRSQGSPALRAPWGNDKCGPTEWSGHTVFTDKFQIQNRYPSASEWIPHRQGTPASRPDAQGGAQQPNGRGPAANM